MVTVSTGVLSVKKKPTREAFDQAQDFVDASRQLNYRRIAAHDPSEVSRLDKTVKTMELPRAAIRKEPLNSRLSLKSAESGFDIWKARVKSLRDLLIQNGFEGRVDKLYSSNSDGRLIDIDQVAHRRGLPGYDLLVAPDFAPVAGLHGILVVGDTVRSMILPEECVEVGAWRLLRQKTFGSELGMIEWVQRFASGSKDKEE